MLEKLPVYFRHFLCAYEYDSQFRFRNFQFYKQLIRDLLEQARIDFLGSLTVGDGEVHSFFALSR